jgi:hypothetical protein
MATPREVFLAPQFAEGTSPSVTRVRSTLLSASLQGVRQMGWEKRYFSVLPAALHDEIRMLIAGVWIALDLAIAHYTACDRMELSPDEIREMGKAVSFRTQKTFVGTLGSVVAGAGATPWSIYTHSHRIWGRIFDGGDMVIYKVGPKDMDVVCVGCPLFTVRYFRRALTSYYAAIVSLVAKSVHCRELAERRGANEIALRISWV